MGAVYFLFKGMLLIYLLVDGRSRKVPSLWAWTLGTILAEVLVLPFYLSSRPLRQGEVRVGGFIWNVAKNFALVWTLFCISLGILGEGRLWKELFTYLWYVPLICAGIPGLLARLLTGDVEERGPTGPLADDEEDS